MRNDHAGLGPILSNCVLGQAQPGGGLGAEATQLLRDSPPRSYTHCGARPFTLIKKIRAAGAAFGL